MNTGDSFNDYTGFLDSLKGKVVKVFSGGQGSLQGVLIDVKSDYIALLPQNNMVVDSNLQQNSVVYLHAQHIKSVSEDTRFNSMQSFNYQQLQIEFVQSNDFRGIIEKFHEKYVLINQGGLEEQAGLLLDIVDDYIVLFSEDQGIVYFNIDQVKSIFENKQNAPQDRLNSDKSQRGALNYIEATDFHDLFSRMIHRWVSINRGGEEAIEGVLVESRGGYYTLVSNEEVLRLHPNHIISISSGSRNALNTPRQNNTLNQNMNNNQNSNQIMDQVNLQNILQSLIQNNLLNNVQNSNQNLNQNQIQNNTQRVDELASNEENKTPSQRNRTNNVNNNSNNNVSSRNNRNRGRTGNGNEKRIPSETVEVSIDYDWNPDY